jgi:RimJ/RimL family protein N-acetyltransferase
MPSSRRSGHSPSGWRRHSGGSAGCGIETARLLLDYGSAVLGLHTIMLTVFSINERGRRAYLRDGFHEPGRRGVRRIGDRAFDVISMDRLATEFRSPVLHHLPRE